MNALECMQNPHRYVHAWLMHVYNTAHCVQEYWTTYPAPEHVYGTLQMIEE